MTIDDIIERIDRLYRSDNVDYEKIKGAIREYGSACSEKTLLNASKCVDANRKLVLNKKNIEVI